jgi:chaperonin GroES
VSSQVTIQPRRRIVKIKIKPLADRVLVKRLETDEEQKVGGIIIPDTAKEKPQEAEVIAVGPGKIEDGKRVALEVKKGDKILIGKYSGTEVKVEGEEYLIMREDDILAIVE